MNPKCYIVVLYDVYECGQQIFNSKPKQIYTHNTMNNKYAGKCGEREKKSAKNK